MGSTRRGASADGVLAVAVLAGVMLGCLGGCGCDSSSARPTPVEADSASTSPRAVCDKTEHDFGTLDPSEPCRYVFVIRNEGDAALRLSEGATTCKCTTGELPERPIPPGGQAEFVVASKLAQESGDFSHAATVQTNDPNQPVLTFKLVGTVAPLLAARPSRLHFAEVEPGVARMAETVVYSHVFDEFTIADVRCSLPGVTWDIQPAPAERLAEVKARSGWILAVGLPVDLPSRGFHEPMELTADPGDGQAPRELSLVLSGETAGRVTVHGKKLDAGRALLVGLVRAGEPARERLTLKINDENRNMTVRAVHAHPEFVHVQVAPYDTGKSDSGLYRIEVEIPGNAPLCDFMGVRAGSIVIETDHPRIPVMEFGVHFAVVPTEPGRATPSPR